MTTETFAALARRDFPDLQVVDDDRQVILAIAQLSEAGHSHVKDFLLSYNIHAGYLSQWVQTSSLKKQAELLAYALAGAQSLYEMDNLEMARRKGVPREALAPIAERTAATDDEIRKITHQTQQQILILKEQAEIEIRVHREKLVTELRLKKENSDRVIELRRKVAELELELKKLAATAADE